MWPPVWITPGIWLTSKPLHEFTFSLRPLCAERISDTLSQQGHKVFLLREVLPVGSPDSAVIGKAQELGAVLFPLNGDFSDIVTYPPGNFLGIVAVQLHNHPETIPQVMKTLETLFKSQPLPEFYRGKLFIAEVHRVRIRH